MLQNDIAIIVNVSYYYCQPLMEENLVRMQQMTRHFLKTNEWILLT